MAKNGDARVNKEEAVNKGVPAPVSSQLEFGNKTVHEKVSCALSCLTSVKKLIIECRFGLNGVQRMTHESLADMLSKRLSPETKLAIAVNHGRNDILTITSRDIEMLEAQALRELSRAKKN